MVDLKSIRKEKGLSGIDVCRQAKLSRSGLSMIEIGQRRPSVELAKRLGAVLGFDWTRFYEDAEPCGVETGAISAAETVPVVGQTRRDIR